MSTHGDESGDLLSVLDELHTHTLADGRIWLFCLDANLLQHNPFGVRRSSGGGGLVNVA